MDMLEKEHSFDLPQGILEQEFKDIWHRIEHAKKAVEILVEQDLDRARKLAKEVKDTVIITSKK